MALSAGLDVGGRCRRTSGQSASGTNGRTLALIERPGLTRRFIPARAGNTVAAAGPRCARYGPEKANYEPAGDFSTTHRLTVRGESPA